MHEAFPGHVGGIRADLTNLERSVGPLFSTIQTLTLVLFTMARTLLETASQLHPFHLCHPPVRDVSPQTPFVSLS